MSQTRCKLVSADGLTAWKTMSSPQRIIKVAILPPIKIPLSPDDASSDVLVVKRTYIHKENGYDENGGFLIYREEL